MKAKVEQERKETLWKVYVADSLYYIPDNKRLSKHYTDFLQVKQVEQRSGDDIVKDVMLRGGLRFK